MSDNWIRQTVMYSVLIDRFARGGGRRWIDPDYSKPVFCGGDIEGIIDRLDYIRELGADSILLSPFHPTAAYHGYHVMDLFGVEPRFGTPETLKRLLEEAHARGVRVVMDFVLGHVSRHHPFFEDARRNPQSKYRDWFIFRRWPDDYMSFLNFPDLPKMDMNNPAVRQHYLDAALHWVDFGFDGLRVDHIIGVPYDFLDQLHQTVKSRNPDVVLIGEAVKGRIKFDELPTLRMRHKHLLYVLGVLGVPTAGLLQRQYVKVSDALFDFFFRNTVKKFVMEPRWYKPHWLMRAILFLHERFFPVGCTLIRLLDNPDHDRFSFAAAGDQEKIRESVRQMLAGNGAAMLFYGNAAGIEQTESRKYRIYGDKPFGDLAIRKLMPWDDINPETKALYVDALRQRKDRLQR
ncbi:MAG: alpha-amylase family glycosyl hydrolase [Patescibacteria group bacterium]|nr:alpha-amylase family glycosyl hydrolase [Patescibacteria group bacterium]